MGWCNVVFLKMVSIVILGSGNVATHLLDAFIQADDVEIKMVYGRNLEALQTFADSIPATSCIDNIPLADVYILAISDSSITEVSELLKHRAGLVVHTSGSESIKALKVKRKGVFYPLQTFTKGKKVDFLKIPICIEATDSTDYELSESLGKAISKRVLPISSEQRKKLHLSAVLVNNFPNYLFTIAHEICAENDISFDLLQPLIFETVDKIQFLHPSKAQTGPARRNDIETIQRHLEQLTNPLHKQIYLLMSESIKKHYEKEL